MLGKENSSNNDDYDESELKRTLYESMKNSRVFRGLKSQLRNKLCDQLKLKS